jgi:uncharacterized membrane protein YeaQ/YmgE (transglycosylase-associated protein family)
MFSLLLWLIIGGLWGWLTSVIIRPSARSVMVQNIVIGSVSALLGGFLGRALGLYGPGEAAGFVLSSLVTIIILAIVSLFRRRKDRSPVRQYTRSPPPAAVAGVHVFISYRRDDTAGYAGRLFDRLSQHFGQENVFMDIDTIEPGLDFVEAIERAVGSCDVLLALIGHEWLQSTDARGHRRIDDPQDFVRLEIATALDRNIRVIPVVVEGARMPTADELPAPLQPLARRNALDMSNTRWQFDVNRLIEGIQRTSRRSPHSS